MIRHIGIIMDGNGRWAKARGLPRSLGHRQGAETLKKIAKCGEELGLEALTVYAFSTENWKRPKDEVDYLMGLLKEFLDKAAKDSKGKNMVIRIIGDVSALPPELQESVAQIESATRDRSGMILNIAVNYGGRSEIVNAARTLAKRGEEITEESLNNAMYTGSLPDPDIIIRPSGEMRLSNFMLWQAAYSEFWYSNVLWPDFSKKELLKAIKEVESRSRRFGGL